MEDDEIIDLTVPEPVIPSPKNVRTKRQAAVKHSGSMSKVVPTQIPVPTRPTPQKRKASKKEKLDDEEYEDDEVEISSPSKQKKTKKVEEKRLARWRSSANSGTRDRIQRALHQKMFLISRSQKSPLEAEFIVLGSIGNVYTVTICKLPSCTCPDGEKGNLCKHILFVYLKVLKVPSTSELIYQTALLTTELESIFAKAPSDPSIMASKQVVQKYKELTGEVEQHSIERRPIDGDCPVCYETMTAKQAIVWCEHSCGNNIHQECFQQWSSSKKKQAQEVTCVWCRGSWNVDPKKPSKSHSNEGFINLGKFQPELPQQRDTSTYREYSDWMSRQYDYY